MTEGTTRELAHQGLTDADACALSKELATNKTLTSIDLRLPSHPIACSIILGIVLSQQHLRKRVHSVHSAQARDFRMCFLQLFLHVYSHSQSNQIGDAGATALEQAIRFENTTLIDIKISDNPCCTSNPSTVANILRLAQ
eukprot:scaffold99444_cov21-Tisochrysis_lutea.AAC.3